jgi:ABC-2 type transport system ATP-binding protein
MSVALRCTGLVKSFGDVQAVRGVDLEVRAGECFGLLGPNGAGKTTTVEMLEGLTASDGGSVELFGVRWGAGRDQELRTRIGIALQQTELGEKLFVEEVVRLFRSFYARGRSVDEVLALVDLESKRRARIVTLSGGQKQRLAVATALVSDPDILFLDEPTTGLDPQARLKLWEVIGAFRSRGGTVLLTTHYMEEAARLCDRVAIMDTGKVIALGTPAELIASLGADRIIEVQTRSTLDVARLAALPGVKGASKKLERYVLSVREVASAMPAVLAELGSTPIDNLAVHEATLDDVFIHLTGKALRDG